MGFALRLLNALLRGSLWLLAALLIFAALYVSAGRQLTPLMAEYRDEIQQGLQQHLRQSIQVERFEGGWRGFSPLLKAHDVRLGEGEHALLIDSLDLQPDVIASLLARELRLKALILDGLQVRFQEDQDGQWSLQGLQLDDTERTVFQLNDWLYKLGQVAQLSVLNSRVIIQGHEQESFTLTYAGFTLSRIGLQQRLDLRGILPDGEALELSAQGQFVDDDWRSSDLSVYVKTPSSNLAQWIPKKYMPDWNLETVKAGAELWLHAQQGQMQRAVLRLIQLELQGQFADAEPLYIQSKDGLAFYQNDQGIQSAWFERLLLQINELKVRDWQLWAAYDNVVAPRWQLAIKQLELSDVQYVLDRVVQLPDKAVEVMQSMQPRGLLNNLQLQWRPEAKLAERLSFSSGLQNIEFSAWEAVPAAFGINGLISGDLTQGELRLSSSSGFGLHLSHLFAEPWQYQQVHAQLLWMFDEQGFTLQSPYLQVKGDEGDIAGDFLIRLLKDPAAEDYMDLRVGLRDGDARFNRKYLPSLAPGFNPALEQWLGGAIQAGMIEQGYYQYQGALNRDAPANSRSMSLYFAVKNAQLDYQPGWPVLNDADVEVVVEDDSVRIHLDRGVILNTPITYAYAEVAASETGAAPVLQLRAELQSNVADGLYFLQKTPIAQTATAFSHWQGQGSLPATLDLRVPLTARQPVQVKLDLNARGAELNMPEINVHLHDLNGVFSFDSQRGLTAKKIEGRFLGQKFSGAITAEGTAPLQRTHLDVRGVMPIARLTEWGQIKQRLPVTGNLPYRLRVMLDGEDTQLRLDSNMQGVAVDLPAPLGKTAQQSSYLDWRMTLVGAERRYWLDYADQLSLSLAAPAGEFFKGRAQLHIGGGLARLPSQRGLQITGRLLEFKLEEWQQVLQRYSGTHNQADERLLTQAKLTFEQFNGFGISVDHLNVELATQAKGWTLLLDSRQLRGRLTRLGEGKPLQVRLARLHLPAQSLASDKEKDPLAGFDMLNIPALDIKVDQLYRDGDLLGAWSLSTRRQAHGVIFDRLNLSLKGLKLTGQLGWERVGQQTRSWYKGQLGGDDIGEVLVAWGFAPNITSKHFTVDADMRWSGSPAAFSLAQLSGDLNVDFRQGQLTTLDGSAQALRVFGVFNFDAIGRRLRLDFSDLIGKGLAYDRIKGRVVAHQGIYQTRDLIAVEGPSSNLELKGRVNAGNEQINASLLVALPLTNNLPLAAIAVGAPAVGGALFLVDRLIGDRISRFASVTYHINGDLHKPHISLSEKKK